MVPNCLSFLEGVVLLAGVCQYASSYVGLTLQQPQFAAPVPQAQPPVYTSGMQHYAAACLAAWQSALACAAGLLDEPHLAVLCGRGFAAVVLSAVVVNTVCNPVMIPAFCCGFLCTVFARMDTNADSWVSKLVDGLWSSTNHQPAAAKLPF
eukprot:GHRR01026022.1.p1 GENE.GHRR01026022.1~~GHRR01026022.1.p1  ORF type:complete len:151 (+),score=30.56 GHRR01026022.1:674-1126(+)